MSQISAHQGGSWRRIPTLGTKHSHVGNKVFPRWESITSLRIANKQHLSSNKEPLLQNKTPLLQHKGPLLTLFMSLGCHQYVVSMSFLCRFYVVYMSFLCRFYAIRKFRNHLITSRIQQPLCHMSLVFKISAKKLQK